MNETSASPEPQEGVKFYDNLDYMLMECRSGDPSGSTICQLKVALGVFSGLVLPIFILLGFLGNSITAYIYLWKQRPWTRQGVYFAMIAMSDNCNLVMTGAIVMFLGRGLPWISNGTLGYFLVNASSQVCTTVRYFEMLFSLTSSTLFLAMVTDRVLSVYFPLKFQLVTAKASMKVCLLILLVDVLLTVPHSMPIRWVEFGGYIMCTYDSSMFSEAVNNVLVLDSLLFYYPPVLPILLILVINLFLIAKMRSIILEHNMLREGDANKASVAEKLTNTIICVVLSIVLLVCCTPSVVAATYIASSNPESLDPYLLAVVVMIIEIGQFLVLINQSVNWTILLWKNLQFRNAFISIICPKSYHQVTSDRKSTTEESRPR